MTGDEHAVKACTARGIRSFRSCRILWILVEISLGILVIFKNLWVRLRLAEAQLTLTLPSAGAAGTTTMTAARVADIFAMIDDHTAAGTMSGKQVEAICAMINDCCHDDAKDIHREKGRRRHDAGIGSTRCYKQMRRLGKGSCGRVVMARHHDTGQTVALKTIHARGGARRPNVGELLKEACVLAACRGHPNLVGLHAIVRDPGTKQYCLIMDYVGPNLFDALDRHVEEHGRAFPEADVRRVMRQLLTGAAAMHERGIIHRDMKTTNILVGEEDGRVVKFCDYGLAMPTAKAEPPYGLAGTVPYMAPEMLLEKPEYNAAVDMWSLGCVMAEMLSGEELFTGEKATGQVGKILDVLGAPGRKTRQHFESALRADEVQQWRARQRVVRRRDRLRELFPEELLSWHGFHVLKGLLTCNPGKRLTAAAALRCPWFKVDDPGTDDASGLGIGGTALARHTAWRGAAIVR